MDNVIAAHVKKYWVKNGYAKDVSELSDDDVVEIIREGDQVWSGDYDTRRWWTNKTTVVNIDGMFIGFGDAETTGDDPESDKGWKFNPSTITQYEPVEVKTIKYVIKK